MTTRTSESLTPEDVLKRVPLLERVVRDIVETFDERRQKQERLEELVVISRKFSSCEIQETINNLRRAISGCKAALDGYEREIHLLGGTVKDPTRGLIYFDSRRDARDILLVWDLRQPDVVSWHEVDESFADRSPVAFRRGAAASAVEFPDG